MRGRETIIVTRPPERDWQGDPIPGTEVTLQLNGCQLWPRSSTEDSERGRLIIEGWNVYVPPGEAVVDAADVLAIRGEDHAVDGVPGAYDLKGKDKGQIIVTTKAGGGG